MSDCRRGIALQKDWLHTEKWHGRTFYLTDDGRIRGFRTGRCILLPPYDEYLISYKSRDIVLPLEHTHHAHNRSGLFWPVILCDGQVAGNWSATGDTVSTNLFRDDIDLNPDSLREETERYRKYLSR